MRERAAALVTYAMVEKAAETHKLLSPGSIFLFCWSKFRGSGNVILAIGVENKTVCKIPP